MSTATLRMSGTVGGMAFNTSVSRSAEGQLSQDVALVAAEAGTLTTRTDDDEGELTLAATPIVTTGATVDLYWATGRRYGMTVGTVAGNAVPISGGAGDVLPADETAVTVAVQQVIECPFDGDLVKMIAASANVRGRLGFYDGATLKLNVDLEASELWQWVDAQTAANPLAAADVTEIRVTQSGVTAKTFKFGALLDTF